MTDKPDFARIAEEKLPCDGLDCEKTVEGKRYRWHHSTDCTAIYRPAVAAALREMWEQGYKQGWNDREGDLLVSIDRIYPKVTP